MKLNQNRAKSSAISTGSAICGGIAAFAIAKTVREKMPTNKLAKFLPHALIVASIALPALDITPNSDTVNSALVGAGLISGLQVANQLTGATAGVEQTGIKGMIAQYVPTLSGLGNLSLGNQYQYDYSEGLISAGSHYGHSESSASSNLLMGYGSSPQASTGSMYI